MNNFHQNMQKINEENLNLKARLNDGKNKIEELNKKIANLENQLMILILMIKIKSINLLEILFN